MEVAGHIIYKKTKYNVKIVWHEIIFFNTYFSLSLLTFLNIQCKYVRGFLRIPYYSTDKMFINQVLTNILSIYDPNKFPINLKSH